MKKYDVAVIGTGVALGIAFKALSRGLKVALVERGHVGGTCLNTGCVPSKMLIYPADRLCDLRESGRLGLKAPAGRMDFAAVMRRMRRSVSSGRAFLEKELTGTKGLDFYRGTARFVGVRSIEVDGVRFSARMVFVGNGARPLMPPIPGLDDPGCLTNESLLLLEECPRSVVIMGGGYVGVEYAHFLEAAGARVTLVQRKRRLVPGEEPEVSELLRKALSRRMEVLCGAEVAAVSRSRGRLEVSVAREGAPLRKIRAEAVLVAAGRVPNTDILDPRAGGIETDGRGYIAVDDHLATNVAGVWAVGDINGRAMFTHAGDKMADLAWSNAVSRTRSAMPWQAVPHAVYTRPQIASVGLTEAEARKSHRVSVGTAAYSDVVKGEAMGEEEGFAKAVLERKTGRILGFHIAGPEAAVLVQEVANAMALGLGAAAIESAMHVFPSLSELVPEALGNAV